MIITKSQIESGNYKFLITRLINSIPSESIVVKTIKSHQMETININLSDIINQSWNKGKDCFLFVTSHKHQI
jgi:hypothetical protein